MAARQTRSSAAARGVGFKSRRRLVANHDPDVGSQQTRRWNNSVRAKMLDHLHGLPVEAKAARAEDDDVKETAGHH